MYMLKVQVANLVAVPALPVILLEVKATVPVEDGRVKVILELLLAPGTILVQPVLFPYNKISPLALLSVPVAKLFPKTIFDIP